MSPRRFGNPGRLDIASLDPAPAAAFTANRVAALGGFLLVGVVMLGACAVLAFGLYCLGAAVEMRHLVGGR